MAFAPFAAVRSTSSAARRGSHSGHQHQWDETPRRARGPGVGHPVVVGAEAFERERAVARFEERLTAIAREHGEAQRRQDAIGGHCLGTRARVVAPRFQLVVAGDVTQALCRAATLERRPRNGTPGGLVDPVQQPVVTDFGVRRTLAVLGAQAPGPQIFRFDDVVIDRHDPLGLRGDGLFHRATTLPRRSAGLGARGWCATRRCRPPGADRETDRGACGFPR